MCPKEIGVVNGFIQVQIKMLIEELNITILEFTGTLISFSRRG